MEFVVLMAYYPEQDQMKIEEVARFVSYLDANEYVKRKRSSTTFKRYWLLHRKPSGRFRCLDYPRVKQMSLTEWVRRLYVPGSL